MERWKPRNGELAKMRSFRQSKRSDNKQYTVEVRRSIFFENSTYFFIPNSGRKYSHTNSYNSAMTVIAQNDHLTAGAWAACADSWSYLARMENFDLNKIDEWMKTWWVNIFTFLEMLARIFVFLFSNNRSISVYCLGFYEINGFIQFHAGLKRKELF